MRKMTPRTMMTILALSAASLFAVQPKVTLGADNGAEGDQVIAVVNGTVLTMRDLAAYARTAQTRGQQISREEALKGIIDRELVYQDALGKGLDKLPNVASELNNQRRTVMANVAIGEMLNGKPPNEAEMRKFYDENVGKQRLKEYKASHILLETEGEAKAVITELDKGGQFAELAKSKSTGPTGSKGGDLGWFTPNQMVPSFSAAAAGLQKGKYTKVPVQTQFGWHVILLEDTRDVQPPKFEDVRERITDALQNDRIGAYVQELRDKAKIETK